MVRLELPDVWLSVYGTWACRYRRPYEPIERLIDGEDIAKYLQEKYARPLIEYGGMLECGRFFDPDLLADRVVVAAYFMCEESAALFRLSHL